MFDFIRNIFAKRMDSVEEFLRFVKENGCTDVLVRAKEKHRFHSGGGRISVSFRQTIRYTTKAVSGRTIVFRTLIREHWCFMDEAAIALRDFALRARGVARQLQQELPNVTVTLVEPDLSDLTPEFRATVTN